MVRRDETELDEILAAVPRRTYSCLHGDYLHRGRDLEWLAFEYGLTHWQTKAKLCTAIGMYAKDNSAKNMGLCKYFDASLAALDAALNAVCKGLGVDAATIKELARCTTTDSYIGAWGDPDGELVEQHIAFLSITVSA
jgi:hypothetical protein